MRKYLLLLVILIRSSLGQAQITTDTICLEVTKFKKIYSAALQKKVADSLLSISEKQVAQLNVSMSLLSEKETETKANYEMQLANLTNQIALYKEQINGYERLVKRERRKRRLTTAAGILTTGAALFLSLQK